MALRMATLKRAMEGLGCKSGIRWCSHVALPAPLESPIDRTTENAFVLPEFDRAPTISFGGSMELMAVPKKKVSKHKRGIRNGPKALKPVPVIIRCRSCGRVKLPHFFCCSGERGITGEHS